ncbi:MAG: HvfC/BufC family peptide modification chaperone [Gammaproteobacteria bacterium]
MLLLRELQQQFIKDLFSEDNETLLHIQSSTHLTAKEQLTIYRHSIHGALQKVLTDIFPVCCKLVGKEFFIAMSDVYIARTDSISPDIGNYGHKFPEFIASFPPAQTLPYLADVARLEWAWHRILSAPESGKLDFQQLSQHIESDNDKIIFILPCESFLLSSEYPIHRIWEVNQETYEGDQTITLMENERYYFFVFRQGLIMRIDVISHDEWQILTWIQSGLTIAQVCEQANIESPELSIEEILPNLVRKQWLTGFKNA